MNIAFRIYNPEYGYSTPDTTIYKEKETAVDYRTLTVNLECGSFEEVKNAFDEHIDIYRGSTYCVKNLDDNFIIVGGIFEDSDIKIIENYFKDLEELHE